MEFVTAALEAFIRENFANLLWQTPDARSKYNWRYRIGVGRHVAIRVVVVGDREFPC
jgi:hypothetical protein